MTPTLWHNPRCSKSRQTLDLLRHRGIEPSIVEYLKTPPTKAELRTVLTKLGMKPRDLLRKGEAAYKSRNLADPALSDADLIQAMTEDPVLIERPVVVLGDRAVLGRPPESVLKLLEEQ